MRYRYYILQVFLFLTLILGASGAWAQTTITINAEQFPVSLTSTALKEVSNKVKSIVKYRYIRSYATLNGGHLWYGVAEIVNANDKPSAYFFYIDVDQFLQIQGYGALEVKSEQYGGNYNLSRVEVIDIAKTYYGYAVSIKIPKVVRLSDISANTNFTHYGECSLLLNEYFNSEYTRTQAEISKPENVEVKSGISNTYYGGAFLIKINGNTNKPMGLLKAPFTNLDATLKGLSVAESQFYDVEYGSYFMQNPNQTNDPTMVVFYSKNILYESLGYAKARENEIMKGSNPSNLKHFLRFFKNFAYNESIQDIEIPGDFIKNGDFGINNIKTIRRLKDDVYLIQASTKDFIVNFSTKSFSLIDFNKLDISPNSFTDKTLFYETTEGQIVSLFTSYDNDFTVAVFSKNSAITSKKIFGRTKPGGNLIGGLQLNENSYGILFPYFINNSNLGVTYSAFNKSLSVKSNWNLVSPSLLESKRIDYDDPFPIDSRQVATFIPDCIHNEKDIVVTNYLIFNDNNDLSKLSFLYYKLGSTNVAPPPLTPAFSFNPTAPKVNQSVVFKDESTGSPTSWAWDFGDGTTSTLQNPTKTYNKAGNYTVKLTISKQGATAASTTKSVTIAAEANTLTLSTTTRNAPVAGEQGGLNISTNTNWTASSNTAWLKVSSTSGNAGTNIAVNYIVEANTATAARTGIITFTAGTQTATFTVTQAGVAPSLAVSPTAPATIAAAGSTVALSVVSNLSWSVAKSANSDWLTVSPTSGTGNQNVSATASANATTAERSATLTFSAAGVANVIVTIRQAGVNASLSLSSTTSNAPVGGQQGSLNLTTNTNWTASSNAAWLKVSPASGNAGTNVVVNYTVEANTTTAARTGIITFTAGNQTATFTVTQAGITPQLSLSTESKSVAATGETGQLGITSNVAWTATSNVAWLTFSPASGGIGVINNFRYGVEANPNTTTRTGVITFSASGLTKTFTVTQEGTKPTPPQAPTQLTVTATSEYELRISWKDNATNETSYELERADGLLLGPTNSDFKKIATLPANTTTVLDQKLTSKSRYCYRVRAVNAVGASEFSETVCGTTNAPPAGITLMVHGFNPSDDADFKENFAVISQAIKERAGAGATVYTNDPTKGTWRKWELVENNGNGDPTKEIILFYNWAVASNNELLRLENLRNNLRYMSNSGYLEGSADILFAMLADAQIPTLPNNLLTTGKSLHFIGHSRGNVLLSQLMHRMAKWFPNVKIDHYTALDPHPATTMGDVVRQQENTYSSLPLISGIASNCTATIGCSSASSGFDEIKIRIPENVVKAEAYYRKDGSYEDADKVLENILQAYLATSFSLPATAWNLYTNRYDKLVSAFDGVPSIGGVNHQLDNTKISMGNTGGLGGAHSGVVSWYFGTIDTRLTGSDGEPISYDGEPLYLNEWYGSNGALLASKSAREKSGYYFSRVGGGYAQLPDATEKVNLAEMDRQLSIRPRVGNADVGMKLGVQNGNFEYNNDSGWKYGGGNIASNNQAKNGQVIVSGSGLSIKPEINITHSLMYYPANFNYVMAHIKFDTKQTATKTFSVQFLNRDLTAIGQAVEVVPTKNDTKVFIKIPASLKGKSGSFTIKGTGILIEKVEFSDRTGSQDLIVEALAQPETPVTESAYEVYPNPNNGRFSLTGQGQQAAATSITVVDIMGNVLFKATDNQLLVFNTHKKLDIALPSSFTGSYTLRVESAQGVSFKRIIKE